MFHRVRSIWRRVWLTRREEKRRASPGWEAVNRYQRRASAPCSSNKGSGSTTLPVRLLILRPRSSRMRPRQITFL